MKQKHFIDFHKGITPLFILTLIMLNKDTIFSNMTIWIYFGLHGSYGLLWVLKSQIFPDKSWEKNCSVLYGLLILFGLSLYWITPCLIITGYFNTGVPIILNSYMYGISIFIYSVGVFFHFGSDMYKYTFLQFNANKLIQDGIFKNCRNINYFGELLIYSSFALLAYHWIPFLILGIFIIIVWIPNIIKKEKSLSRYDAFSDYKNRSYLIIPYIF